MTDVGPFHACPRKELFGTLGTTPPAHAAGNLIDNVGCVLLYCASFKILGMDGFPQERAMTRAALATGLCSRGRPILRGTGTFCCIGRVARKCQWLLWIAWSAPRVCPFVSRLTRSRGFGGQVGSGESGREEGRVMNMDDNTRCTWCNSQSLGVRYSVSGASPETVWTLFSACHC